MLAYTNASTIIEDGFQDTEDLDGLFSGYDAEGREYERGKAAWGYKGSTAIRKRKEGLAKQKKSQKGNKGMHGPGIMGGASHHGSKRRDRRPSWAIGRRATRRCRTRTA